MITHLGFVGRNVILQFINMIWSKGIIPSSLKTAIIKPILKKGKPAEEMKRYIPISLSSRLGKLAERIIDQRLYWWLEANKLLNIIQAGFRNGYRTEDQSEQRNHRCLS